VSLVDKLRTHPHANDIVGLPDAYVPIVNVNFSGLMIDLVWAPLKLTTFPASLDIFSERFMEYVHEDGVRGLMGIRSDHAILRLVPNVDNFRTTLRAVKLWAEHRGIYSGMLGYLNGAACAVLTARICQMYPNSSPSLLLFKFFSGYAQWKWGTPGGAPVELADDARVFAKSPAQHPLPSANDVDKNTKSPMIILTPGFEPQNTMRIASNTTVSVIQAELARAKKIVDYITGYTSTTSDAIIYPAISVQRGNWDALFEKVCVTDVSATFVHVHIAGSASSTSEAWRARVASRLRQLIGRLEHNGQGSVEFRPMPCCYKGSTNRLAVQSGVSYVIGVTYKSSSLPAEGVTVAWRDHLAQASSAWVTDTMAWDRRSADQIVTVTVVPKANLPALV
jgi:poly(A) polymerase